MFKLFFIVSICIGINAADDVEHGEFQAAPHTVLESGERTNGDLDPNRSEIREFEPGYEKERRFDEKPTTPSSTPGTTYPSPSTTIEPTTTSSTQTSPQTTQEPSTNYPKNETSTPQGDDKGFFDKVIDYFTTPEPSTQNPNLHYLSTTRTPCCGENCTGPCGAHRACASQCSKYRIQNNNYQGEFHMDVHIHDNSSDTGCKEFH